MRKSIAVLTVLGATVVSMFAQGGIQFNNLSGDATTVNVPVFNTDGTTKVGGTGFSAQLYAGPSGTAVGSLVAQGGPFNFLSGLFAGYIDGSSGPGGLSIVTISGVNIGALAQVQMRVWNNQGGTISSWGSASIRGESISFVSQPLGDPFNAGSVPEMTGMGTGSIVLAAVPEPSTVVLGVMGGLALLLRRRK